MQDGMVVLKFKVGSERTTERWTLTGAASRSILMC